MSPMGPRDQFTSSENDEFYYDREGNVLVTFIDLFIFYKYNIYSWQLTKVKNKQTKESET